MADYPSTTATGYTGQQVSLTSASDKYVGIGYTNPQAALVVSGKVGFGTYYTDYNFELGEIQLDQSFTYTPIIKVNYPDSIPTMQIQQVNAATEYSLLTSEKLNIGIGTTTSFVHFKKNDSNGAQIKSEYVSATQMNLKFYVGNSSSSKLFINESGVVGIGTTSIPSDTKLGVNDGDLEVYDAGKGIVLRSPNGTRWKMYLTDALTIATTTSL